MKYLLIDTREKPKAISTILNQFDEAGIRYERTKLLFGDYMDYNRPQIVVDRKQNIAELAKNCTVEAERFKKDRDEWKRVETIADLMLWSSPHTTIRGEKVFRVLSAWVNKYDIEVRFCDKRVTGRKILEILYGE